MIGPFGLRKNRPFLRCLNRMKRHDFRAARRDEGEITLDGENNL